jgi:hypothetical protein
MNKTLKNVLEKALDDPASGKYETQLDIIFEKLIVIPLQKAWRSMTTEQKQIITQNFPKLIKKRTCLDCNNEFILNNKRHSDRGQCESCYYSDKYCFDD